MEIKHLLVLKIWPVFQMTASHVLRYLACSHVLRYLAYKKPNVLTPKVTSKLTI